ncbi:hypothetical protein IGI37_002612 [Enterococcus sp. AZ194]
MSTHRLFGIIYYLINNNKATITELAEHFEVSSRTIHRDINKLSSLGIPIYTQTGRNGGIHLLDNFLLTKVLLSEEEQNNLLLALKGTRKINPQISDQAFTKLHSLFQSTFDDWLEVDFSTWQQTTSADEKFGLLKTSILAKRQIEFTYVSTGKSPKRRRGQPYKLVFKSQAWYLQALCLEANQFRYFKVNRMSDIFVTDRPFQPQEAALPELPKTNREQEKIPVILEFSKEVFYRVYDEFDYETITQKDKQTVRVETLLPNQEWLIRYLLSFGKSLNVLSPESLRNELKEEITQIMTLLTEEASID